jgi:hypothetical protein
MSTHFIEATKLLADNPGEYEIELARSQATLALAYEQRTANLIAMFVDGAEGPVPGIDYGVLVEQIKERLSL